MSFAITTGAVGLLGAGAQIFSGIRQKNRAKNIREQAVDPGIQRDYSLDRVTNTLFQNYSNWNLPGYQKYVDQIQSNQASANNLAMVGATSSADVLNSITANQAQTDESLANLALQSASGRERALMEYLQSVRAQGQDQIRVNQQELGRYDRTLNEAAALEGAGTQNIWGGVQEGLVATGAMAQNFMPRQTISPATGEVVKLPSVWDSYRNRRRPSSKASNVYGPGSAQLFYDGLTA